MVAAAFSGVLDVTLSGEMNESSSTRFFVSVKCICGDTRASKFVQYANRMTFSGFAWLTLSRAVRFFFYRPLHRIVYRLLNDPFDMLWTTACCARRAFGWMFRVHRLRASVRFIRGSTDVVRLCTAFDTERDHSTENSSVAC